MDNSFIVSDIFDSMLPVLDDRKKRGSYPRLCVSSFTENDDPRDAVGIEKKRGRKPKKQTEKEIMKEYVNDVVKPSTLQQQRKYYENMEYLSPNERKLFEKKFCQPKNPSQIKLMTYLNDPSQKIVIATGPAGTGKTLFATQTAIRHFLLGTYEKIIFTRPSVSVDEELGFLPGSLEEKMAPWMRPLYDILHTFITPKETTQLIEEKIIEICPLGFMRGRTFKNCCIVADEMQNCSLSQMKLVLTRIGENTRLFITGDLEQCDRMGERNGLEDFLDKIRSRRSNSISSVEFELKDVEREAVVREVLEIYAAVSAPPMMTDDESTQSSVSITESSTADP
jgi:phosphate starvation-inducible PhoH-like protein